MPLVIGHRGAAGVMPENTKISFMKAIDFGAEGIEFDVRLTRDQVPIVFHDAILDRTTSGSGLVADTDFSAIRDLDAGSWFSRSSPRAEVSTLDEVLELLGGRVVLNLEMKSEGEVESLVKHAVSAVAMRDLFDSVVFSSFRFSAISLLCDLAPDARVGILCGVDQIDELWARADRVAAENVHPPAPLVDGALVERAHERGLNVWTWVANEPEEIERLCRLGVDGIMSDYPDRVVAVRKRLGLTPQR